MHTCNKTYGISYTKFSKNRSYLQSATSSDLSNSSSWLTVGEAAGLTRGLLIPVRSYRWSRATKGGGGKGVYPAIVPVVLAMEPRSVINDTRNDGRMLPPCPPRAPLFPSLPFPRFAHDPPRRRSVLSTGSIFRTRTRVSMASSWSRHRRGTLLPTAVMKAWLVPPQMGLFLGHEVIVAR